MHSSPGHPAPSEGGAKAAAAHPAPAWIADSPLLAHAFSLAEAAHRSQSRSTDGQPFLGHVTAVARLLCEAGFDEELVAVGLLHDAVERGTLGEEELRGEMGDDIHSLVLALTEDSTIEDFDHRKAALREQVAAAGERAVTVFAADKLSDISGLRWGIATFGDAIEERMGISVSRMERHYRDSVEVVEEVCPDSPFLPALHLQLERLARVDARRAKRHRPTIGTSTSWPQSATALGRISQPRRARPATLR